MTPPISSGTTAVATAGAAAVNLFAASTVQPGQTFKQFTIINGGAADGFISFDGNTWLYVPASGSRTFYNVTIGNVSNVQIKRNTGTDMTAVYADAWE